MPSRGENFFLMLPDSDAALSVASRLEALGIAAGAAIVPHASGRPWIVGRWSDGALVSAKTGGASIVLIGQHSVTEKLLRGEVEKLRDLAELDALARRLPGCYHLVGSLESETRLQGTVSGLRLVFYANIEGVTVAADRADVLGVLLGGGIDERALAARLLHPMPYPLGTMSLWRGVTQVPPDAYLVIGPGGRSSRVRRWWAPPVQKLRLSEAAPLLRDALSAAVEAHIRPGHPVCCDLSGGFDSTTICFLAARTGASVVALTVPGRDPADEDLAWARRAASYLPDVRHDVIPADRVPLVYQDMFDADDPLDEPTQVISRSSHLVILRRIAAHGAHVHLTGNGGDAILTGSVAHLHTAFRRNPRAALRALQGERAMSRWPLGQSLRELAVGGSFADWLRMAADKVVAVPAPNPAVLSRKPKFDWGFVPWLPSWVTPGTLEMARQLIREAADTAEPLGRTRGQHADLATIRSCTLFSRPGEQVSSRAGISIASPYFDDRVINVALAVRPEDCVTPWQYKPLLKEAMRGIVPQPILERTNKAEASFTETASRREHRSELIALFENSELQKIGLIDDGLLRLLRQSPTSPELDMYSLYATLRCEMWLRTHLGNHVSGGPRLRRAGAQASTA
jgi:asparagine synthase (glutamine-hydrolysing)